ncbi:hypothetical protein CTA2_9580 [Colletotrichum tanaceti]|uniref:Uncharacterized protein n=1 Tax=Colletotrichum tanaceti TaxID=1306861 RepID=A0A4U6XF82_9PEZI|nr:hypothetical protein CTA2_9580 [Colletotrichum tanaceti]TKW54093.1 hypothetical protein CTA1_7346 [Colletotrichum tanaceti]
MTRPASRVLSFWDVVARPGSRPFHKHLWITLYYGVLSAAATPCPVAREKGIQSMPRPTPPPHLELSKNKLLRRQFDMDLTTCGYSNGNPTLPITAVKGSQCRIDIEHGLWGFCSADVQAASDCSFVGQCFDTHTCERGCGKTDGGSGIISTTCTQSRQFCQANLLVFAADMTYTEVGCGPVAKTYNFLVTTTESEETSATPTSPESLASSTSTNQPTTTITSTSAGSSSTTWLEATPGAENTASKPSVSSPSNVSSPKGPKLNISAIIGGVLACLALICITILAVIYIVRKHKREESSRQKRRVFELPRKGSKTSKISTDSTDNSLHETQYPDPPDDRVHPEAGWGPSEAYGSEVQPNPHGPWEMLNEERPVELSDENRPVELPDHEFLETLPTIAQAPTRQDSWRPNDDGAAWGDLRPPPRLRDRLRWTENGTAVRGVDPGPFPVTVGNGMFVGERSNPIMAPDDDGVRGRSGIVSSNFASSPRPNRNGGRATRPTKSVRQMASLHVNTESPARRNTTHSHPSQRSILRTQSTAISVASSGEIYTSSPREIRALVE